MGEGEPDSVADHGRPSSPSVVRTPAEGPHVRPGEAPSCYDALLLLPFASSCSSARSRARRRRHHRPRSRHRIELPLLLLQPSQPIHHFALTSSTSLSSWLSVHVKVRAALAFSSSPEPWSPWSSVGEARRGSVLLLSLLRLVHGIVKV